MQVARLNCYEEENRNPFDEAYPEEENKDLELKNTTDNRTLDTTKSEDYGGEQTDINADTSYEDHEEEEN